METAVVALSVACAVLAVACAVLCGSVPFLYWKVFRLERDVAQLDETLVALCKVAGLKQEGEE